MSVPTDLGVATELLQAEAKIAESLAVSPLSLFRLSRPKRPLLLGRGSTLRERRMHILWKS